ncbi:kinase-like domain-containing protein [Radiomyces spectabilis]|uniref:kinase-like domain-containing protein n=1 Tax=Radiomyces spectabilis TaxID=64574 RepID=UPI002220798D|nr:kinase-like domain-containing protein [Radiomyces spectabilis]KAI8388878.1 kinase-like domain-containing protein [Radiomyces spectabilis]
MVMAFPNEQTVPSPSNQKHDHSQKNAKGIGNYTFQQNLGKGSMGKVKLGVHIVTGAKVAVKIVPRANLQLVGMNTAGKTPKQIAKEYAREENREMRTTREAHMMMLLRHPNIVQLKDLVVAGRYFYIMMDYVNGGQLLHYIVKRNRLSEKRSCHFARQIVSALDYMHRNSIVHRDLKIENILIDKSGRNIKIIDFGLSNLFCPERQLTTYCGSLYFAAPELLRATPYNGPEIDVWSLGVVIYVMVTGTVPFDDKSMPGLHEKIKRGHVVYPPYLGMECRDLLSRMFITDPARRIIMADIVRHPWLNRKQPPIQNFLPLRKPLKLPLDPHIIELMSKGMNLGTAEEIAMKLEVIVQSPVYKRAAEAIAHQQTIQSRTDACQPIYDDPQSIPAGYHPLISIYHLTEERQAHLSQMTSHAMHHAAGTLSRKSSVESGLSIGGTSSARSSQTSLVFAGETSPSNHRSKPQHISEMPLGQTAIHHAPTASGSMQGHLGVTAAQGFGSQPAASIASTDYLIRIQRWLRSSTSQYQLPTEQEEPEATEVNEVNDLSPTTATTATTTETITSPSFAPANLPTPPDSDDSDHGSGQKSTRSLFKKLSHALLRRGSRRDRHHSQSSQDAPETDLPSRNRAQPSLPISPPQDVLPAQTAAFERKKLPPLPTTASQQPVHRQRSASATSNSTLPNRLGMWLHRSNSFQKTPKAT